MPRWSAARCRQGYMERRPVKPNALGDADAWLLAGGLATVTSGSARKARQMPGAAGSMYKPAPSADSGEVCPAASALALASRNTADPTHMLHAISLDVALRLTPTCSHVTPLRHLNCLNYAGTYPYETAGEHLHLSAPPLSLSYYSVG